MLSLRCLPAAQKIFSHCLNAQTASLKIGSRCLATINSEINQKKTAFPTTTNIVHQQIRFTSFFNKLTGEQLWKGVTSVSNAGKKRGRGKGNRKKFAKNLNRGQVIGVGKANIIWPGLTTPVIRGKELVERQKLPEDPDREARLIKIRNEMGRFRPLKLSPIERGWSGSKMPGRSIGPPDPLHGEMWEGFDTKVLELKTVTCMTGNLGRTRRQSAFVVTGNKQGLCGIGLAKAIDPKAAMKTAKNKAAQNLLFVERYEGHTVIHDFFTQFGHTKIFVTKMPEGYGLVCHRAIRTVCEVIGITDLYAKVEGSTNVKNVVKAFLIGLMKQKSHEQLADETGLNVVEFRQETEFYPEVVAAPIVSRDDVKEVPDYKQYCFDNKVVLKKKKPPPFYTKEPGWLYHLVKMENARNHDKVRKQLRFEYGFLRSFLYDKYPECRAGPVKKEESES
ncbi:hypothetical protein LSTR_LSTR001964 [Laodelphax striatellus]|uniref:Small ribosomal subunit protein uS5m n=1 Tax=Laodelphax striatellus TaxID=195883 RepID=A0A482XGR8_LAOST|nr:hypothetical protein LSTR_LSTR001964 [Laodelphax striatellus]